jgi:hypothetical protein
MTGPQFRGETAVLVSAHGNPAAKSMAFDLASPPPGYLPQGQKPWRRAGFATQIVGRLAEGGSTARRPSPRRPTPCSCSWRKGCGASMVDDHATAQPIGLTLEQYAAARALPVDFLRECGLSDMVLASQPAVRIPYLGPGGEELAVRFRIALDGDGFRWKSGCKPRLYGLNRIGDARAEGHVVLVEGGSNVHTLWHNRIPAVGLPSGTDWREDRDAECFDGINTIYVVAEPDKGEQVRSWLRQSAIRARASVLELPTNPSAMHVADPVGFGRTWQVVLLGSVAWAALEAGERAEERLEAWESCRELAQAKDILEFDRDLEMVGLVGERRVTRLTYLAVTSRLFKRPVSVAVKGPSSGGKSFTVESVLRFFPGDAFYALTAMSDRALAYSTEPLKHRTLVIYELPGMGSEFASYLIRSLLSEGRLRYETAGRLIEREGPTGLIVTTTALRLHPENETRMLGVTVNDAPQQTRAILLALANGDTCADLSRWHALQTYLAASMCEVVIPYASALAQLIPPVAIRLRRDFRTVLTLIGAHALLHQASRRKDCDGQLIAEIADYAAVRELVADLVERGVDAVVKPEVRETVDAVAGLLVDGKKGVSQDEIKNVLKLDKSVVSRRVAAAMEAGVLRNLEARKGRPARLVLGDTLPEELEILPRPERLHGCTGAEWDEHAFSAGNTRNGIR